MISTIQVLFLVSSASMVLMGLLLLHVAEKHKGHVRGLSDWGGAFLLFVVGQLVLAMIDTATFSGSVIMGHAVILIGLMMASRGLRLFFDEPPRYQRLILQLFVISFVSALFWFTFVDDDRSGRTAVYSGYGILVLSDMLGTLVRNRRFGSGVSLLIGAVVLLIIIRGVRLMAILFANPLDTLGTAADPTLSNVLLLSLPIVLAPVATTAFLILTSDTLIRKLEDTIRQDQLTGLLNKSALQEEMQTEIQRALRYQRPVSLMMIDLDNFKSINDSQGHLQGDAVLKKIARCILDSVRTTDVVARFGGDEFTVLLPETDEATARLVAERTRQHLNLNLPDHCSASIGLATLAAKAEDLDTFMRRADDALYEAKRLGKNQVLAWHQALTQT